MAEGSSGAARPKKLDKTLLKRAAQLKERGIDVIGLGSATMAEIAQVVGDLTLEEFERMLRRVRSEAYIEDRLAINRAIAQQNEAFAAQARAEGGAEAMAELALSGRLRLSLLTEEERQLYKAKKLGHEPKGK
jgi:hypothetical protein